MMRKLRPDGADIAYLLLFPLLITSVIVITAFISPETEDGTFYVFKKSFKIYSKLVLGMSIMYLISKPIILTLNKYFPWKVNWIRRVSVEVVVFILVAIVFNYIAIVAFIPEGKAERIAILIVIMIVLANVSFIEIKFINRENLRLAVALAESEKVRISSQLTALRQQVNPHFLFNSLNVLSSLIYEDQKKAEEFIHEFGDIYRYVLEINEEPVVSLKEELKFLDSYTFLQNIRFGKGIGIHKSIDSDKLNYFLPPLTLQLLIENALKHNVISHASHFEIELYNEGDELIVKNTYRPRKTKEFSLGLGLKNLKHKYDLISDKLPQYKVDEGWFVVQIPLIKSDDVE